MSLPLHSESIGALSTLLALLRSLRWNYLSCHWMAKGDSYYGDHLLFQRLYEALDEEIDALAERTLGLTWPHDSGYPFDNVSQAHGLTYLVESWALDVCPFRRSLRAERDLQTVLSSVYQILEGAGEKTLGLDDMLASLAGAHETNQYLLQQRITEHVSRRASYQHFMREWAKLAKGVSRRERDPDYKAYVKRKQNEGERPMDRATWQRWMDGEDRPDRKPDDSPEDVKEDSKEEKGDSKELSDKDKALLEKAKKTLGKDVQKALDRLDNVDNAKITFFLSDKGVQKQVEKELLRLKDQVNREKMREEISEELRDSDVKLPEGSIDDKEALEAAQKVFEGKDSRAQFAEALVKSLPPEVKEKVPPNFLGFAFQHILDKMLSFAGNPKDYVSAEDHLKEYESYKETYDSQAKTLAKAEQEIEELGPMPEDPKKRKEWSKAVLSATKKYRDASGAIEEAAIKYSVTDKTQQKLLIEQSKGKRAELDQLIESVEKKGENLDKLQSEVESMAEKKKDFLSKLKKRMEAQEELRTEIEDLREEVADLDPDSEEHKKETKSLKQKIKRLEKMRKQDLPKIASEPTEAETDVADWFLDEMVDRLTDLDDKDVTSIVDKMVTASSTAWIVAKYKEAGATQTSEGYFFDDPMSRETREFAQSHQRSNLTKKEQGKGAPPTPKDIHNQKGGETFSSLHRLLVKTEEKVQNRGHRKHKKVAWAGWTFAGDKK